MAHRIDPCRVVLGQSRTELGFDAYVPVQVSEALDVGGADQMLRKAPHIGDPQVVLPSHPHLISSRHRFSVHFSPNHGVNPSSNFRSTPCEPF